MNDPAAEIRRRVTMKDVCAMYGYKPNRAGYISCPIHNEKTPSLRIYPGEGGWHCFGCGTGGSVIDFVMHVFGIDFRQAIVRIDNDFGLRLTDQQSDSGELLRLRRERAEKERKRAEFDRQYLAKVKQHCEYINVLKTKTPTKEDEQPDPEFLCALRELPYLEYWLDEMRGGDSH